ncbi:SDR family oxidoreductase [Inquilinus limosus]|uniref:SDR family oxidoreductase n=1 Tax=Inquilinus limosus TaxID=171674 RepID=UPI003F16F6CF
MRVVLVGSTGFIGQAVRIALERRGTEVVPAGRTQGVDLERPETVIGLRHRLDGAVGLVIAAGTLDDDPPASNRLTAGVVTLLDQAALAGIRNLVLVSSAGADPAAPVASLRGKAAQEAALLGHRADDGARNWTIVRPSLVCGHGGASARLLAGLASLPIRPRIPSGPLRPIRVDDLAEAIARLLLGDRSDPAVLDACGPDRVDLEGYIRSIEGGARPAVTVPVPPGLMRRLFRLGGKLGVGMAGDGMVTMLQRGADGDPEPLRARTGVRPRPLSDATAGLMPSVPLLRGILALSLAAFWIWSGLSSVLLWPIAQSAELARQAGVPETLAVASVYAGGILDMVIGVALLARRSQPAAALAAAVVTLAYMAIMTVGIPHLWFDPLGPVAKGLPLAAAAFGLAMLAKADAAAPRKGKG